MLFLSGDLPRMDYGRDTNHMLLEARLVADSKLPRPM